MGVCYVCIMRLVLGHASGFWFHNKQHAQLDGDNGYVCTFVNKHPFM